VVRYFLTRALTAQGFADGIKVAPSTISTVRSHTPLPFSAQAPAMAFSKKGVYIGLMKGWHFLYVLLCVFYAPVPVILPKKPMKQAFG
jgi:hypothetical protein